MSKAWVKLIIIVLIISLGKLVQCQVVNDFIFRGITVNKENLMEASFVTIQNARTKKIVTSDNKGYFEIRVRLTDTLYLAAMSYYSMLFFLNDSVYSYPKIFKIYLNPKYIKLKEVEIIASMPVRKKYDNPYNQAPATLANPISLIYERFDKKLKAYKRVSKLVAKDNYWEYLQWRFSNNNVYKITHLEGEKLDDFIRFCDFDESFGRNAKDYDFLIEVKK
ncbi:MAG TPA: hypothetical protein PKL64_07425, partial [Bacteroidales bacterium]|nr:hypothetical protein [Bacteroidales bacterium]